VNSCRFIRRGRTELRTSDCGGYGQHSDNTTGRGRDRRQLPTVSSVVSGQTGVGAGGKAPQAGVRRGVNPILSRGNPRRQRHRVAVWLRQGILGLFGRR
jgi:hypothetical protein